MAQEIAQGRLSSTEVLEAHIDRIAELNPKLNALVIPLFDEARGTARAAIVAARGSALGMGGKTWCLKS